VKARQPRLFSEYTRFWRNQPLFDRLRDIALAAPRDRPFRLAVLGCSTGAELYSAMWVILAACPELQIQAAGVDISTSVLAVAAHALYMRDGRELADLPDNFVSQMLQPSGAMLEVRRPYREGVSWHQLDIGDPALVRQIGERDVVLANNVFTHMSDDVAEAAMRNAVALLAPGGYLMTYGVDLDVKSRVVRSCGLVPDETNVRAIYEANARGLARWPLRYSGCEPMDTKRRDWRLRYAAVYQRPRHALKAIELRKEPQDGGRPRVITRPTA
jgi:hypothetical protein